MLGVRVPDGISEWDYEKIRCYLFLESAGFKFLIEAIKNKHALNHKSKAEINKRLDFSSLGVDPKLKTSLDAVNSELNLPDYFLENVLLGSTSDPLLEETSLPITIANGEPLREGFYIRVDRHTGMPTVKKSFAQIKKMWKRHDSFESSTADSGALNVRNKISARDRKQMGFELMISVYSLIENYVYKHKGKHNKMFNSKVDREAVVLMAVEEVCNELTKKKLVNESDMWKQLPVTQNKYYRLLEKYRIPPLSKFPVIT